MSVIDEALEEQTDVEERGGKPMCMRCLGAAVQRQLDPGMPIGEDIVDAYTRCIREWCPAAERAHKYPPLWPLAGSRRSADDTSTRRHDNYPIAPTLLFRILAETNHVPRCRLFRDLPDHRVCFLPALLTAGGHSHHWILVVVVPSTETVLVANSLHPTSGLDEKDQPTLPAGLWTALRTATGGAWARPARWVACPRQASGANNNCGLHMLQNLEVLYVLRRVLPWCGDEDDLRRIDVERSLGDTRDPRHRPELWDMDFHRRRLQTFMRGRAAAKKKNGGPGGPNCTRPPTTTPSGGAASCSATAGC